MNTRYLHMPPSARLEPDAHRLCQSVSEHHSGCVGSPGGTQDVVVPESVRRAAEPTLPRLLYHREHTGHRPLHTPASDRFLRHDAPPRFKALEIAEAALYKQVLARLADKGQAVEVDLDQL